MRVWPTTGLLSAGVALALAGCGGDSNDEGAATQPATSTPTAATTTRTTPPEKPVTVVVNGEDRVVTLSRVTSAYCVKKTDVCAALRDSKYARLSAEGKRAVRAARRRKAAREAAEREAQRQQEQQQQQQPPPQPQSEGTTTG